MAVWPDEATLDAIAPAARWVGEQSGYRAVRREHLHVTVAFIGEVEPARVDAISEALGRLSEMWAAFRAPPGSLTALPNARRPRILAVGFDETGDLARLSDKVVKSLAQVVETVGLRKALERSARPHLTLARWKGRWTPGRLDLSGAPGVRGALPVRRLSLVQSILEGGGPVYRAVEAFPLREPE